MLRRTHLIVDDGNPTGNGERLIIERAMDGLATARARGRVGGCRKIMARSLISQAKGLLLACATRQQVADVIGVDVKTIYKYLPAT